MLKCKDEQLRGGFTVFFCIVFVTSESITTSK